MLKEQAKVGLGLLLGALAGGLAAAFLPGAGWIHWLADNVTDPAGQIFLRVLFMTVIPLVFLSVTLGVAGLGDPSRCGGLCAKTLAYFVLFGALGLSTLVWVFAGVRPARFWGGAWTPLITGLSTTSSAATLPVTMATAEHHFGVSPDISGLVLPFGVTLNVNGTALFQAV